MCTLWWTCCCPHGCTHTARDPAWGLLNTRFFIFLIITLKPLAEHHRVLREQQPDKVHRKKSGKIFVWLFALFSTLGGRTRRRILSGLNSIGSALSAAAAEPAPSLPSLPRLGLLVSVGCSLSWNRCKESKTFRVWCTHSHRRHALLSKHNATAQTSSPSLSRSHRGSPDKYAFLWATWKHYLSLHITHTHT